MPMDPFFTSAWVNRSATIWAREKADPELLKLQGKERSRKIRELKDKRRNGEYLSSGEFWFVRSVCADFATKRKLFEGRNALRIKERYKDRQPTIFGGFNTKA